MSESSSFRKIIHIDMDAFFAAVEQRDNPSLRGKAIAVGGGGKRGVVAAASYEARKFGVHSALASKIAIQRCPHLIFVPHRFHVYREVSKQIRAIFAQYTELIEPLSLDEAYLDVTQNFQGNPSATLLAKEIKAQILTETQLTASAGVSYNKFLAKIASDYRKPDGLFTISPPEAKKFIQNLPIEKFHGIGKVGAKKMHKLGIPSGKELQQRSELELVRNFGKVGRFYFHIAQGQDFRPVNPHRIRKSIGSERTFSEDLKDREDLLARLQPIAENLAENIQKKKIKAFTLTLKVKYADFKQITRSKTSSRPYLKLAQIKEVYTELLDTLFPLRKGVRLLGLQISNLKNEESKPKAKVYQLKIPFPGYD